MNSYVLRFQDVDATNSMTVGGKGANLGELSSLKELTVPEGFCVSTDAFKSIMHATSAINVLLAQLALLTLQDQAAISELSAEIRSVIENIAIPDAIQHEITETLAQVGANHAYAIRSSATAEDLPTASFAGQYDSYLNIIGPQAILNHISKCWASLFTERAITYRLQNGFEHRHVALAVVVQKMIFPQAAGMIFTADPVTGHRKTVAIDAGFGLGEALVSGLVNADTYKVCAGEIIDKKISSKKLVVYALKEGGTITRELEPERQDSQVLTDDQMVQLERIGRTIEAHFGRPQDIEWCLVDHTFYIVQSRPITALYPIPEIHDQQHHVYVSVAHQQMMTDAMKPLGLSFWQLTAARPMYQAGGRLFVDVISELASPVKRNIIIDAFGKADPLIKDALMTIIERGDIISSLPTQTPVPPAVNTSKAELPADGEPPIEYDATIISELIQHSQTAIEILQHTIQTKSAKELFEFILEDLQQLKQSLFDPQSFGAIMAAMNTSAWINEHMLEWLGEKNAADALSQSVPHNITSQMGLALLDVADAIRPYPEVIAYLHHVQDHTFLDQLEQVHGGQAARSAIDAFLEKYGMRCAGEIDITKPRWNEQPQSLIPTILRNVNYFDQHASKHKFEQGLQEALTKENDILDRLKQLPDGEQKAQATKRMIDLMRNVIGYREYPKYAIVQRYFVYKQALLKAAEQLVQAHVLRAKEDIYYLSFEELREVVHTQTLDYQIINNRKAEYTFYEKLTPPRVITADGESITGAYKREHLPVDALPGLPVSAGVIEGRAHVILKMEDADPEADAILVTAFTDPSWTPLFVSIKGLVTEVGGLMTHGAVIAREYGLPAVVGVENATRLIQDGQYIRVHGTEGYIEIL